MKRWGIPTQGSKKLLPILGAAENIANFLQQHRSIARRLLFLWQRKDDCQCCGQYIAQIREEMSSQFLDIEKITILFNGSFSLHEKIALLFATYFGLKQQVETA